MEFSGGNANRRAAVVARLRLRRILSRFTVQGSHWQNRRGARVGLREDAFELRPGRVRGNREFRCGLFETFSTQKPLRQRRLPAGKAVESTKARFPWVVRVIARRHRSGPVLFVRFAVQAGDGGHLVNITGRKVFVSEAGEFTGFVSSYRLVQQLWQQMNFAGWFRCHSRIGQCRTGQRRRYFRLASLAFGQLANWLRHRLTRTCALPNACT